MNSIVDIPSMFSISFMVTRCSNLSHMLTESVFLTQDHNMPETAKLFYNLDDSCRIGWNESGIAFELFSNKSPKEFKNLKLFINVRRSTLYESSTKFCHVFDFSLASTSKPWFLLSSKLLGDVVDANSSFGAIFYSADKKKNYSFRCWISAEALVGYDPYEFRSLGFSLSYMWGNEDVNMTGGVDIESIKPVCWSVANLKQDTFKNYEV